jgi:short-subunit dehydrogenase
MTGSTLRPPDVPLVYITGASSGIGQALAARFRQAGFRLALVARRAAEVQAWAESMRFERTTFTVYGADVRDVAAITGAGRECLMSQGLPDIVIANAGIDTAQIEDLDVMRATFETNNVGMAATFQPFVAPMAARRSGALVGIASVAGIRGLPGHGAYCASKAAVISYCESLRVELRPSGVQVVTLLPGYIDTPLTQGNRYGMPFLMQPEAFAERAYAAIIGRRTYRVIPWQMGIVAKVLRALPNAVFDRVLASRPRKQRRTGA